MEDAQAAFDIAQRRGWTFSTTQGLPNPLPWRMRTGDIERLGEGTVTTQYYVVIRGRRPGVYASYVQAALLTLGVPGAVYESFSQLEAALKEYVKARGEDRARRIEGM